MAENRNNLVPLFLLIAGLAGCAAERSSEEVLRLQQDRIRSLEGRVQELNEELAAARRAVALSDSVPPPSDIRSVGLRGNSSNSQPELAGRVTQLRLHRLLTVVERQSEESSRWQLDTVLTPLDYLGDTIKVSGHLTVRVEVRADGEDDDSAPLLSGEIRIDAGDVLDSWRRGLLGSGYVVSVPLIAEGPSAISRQSGTGPWLLEIRADFEVNGRIIRVEERLSRKAPAR